MDLAAAIAITIIAILFSGLFSGAEIAFVQSDKVRIKIDATRRGLVSRILQGFAHRADMFISTLLVGNNIALVIYGIAISVILNPILQKWFPGSEALLLICNTLISTLIILVTGEFFPKTIFRINPNFTMRLVAFPLWLIYWILYPVSWLTSALSCGLMRLFGIHQKTTDTRKLTIEQIDDYIQQTIDQTPDRRQVENEVKIFQNALDFKTTQAGECMTPRNEISAINLQTTTRHQLIHTFITTGLSKIVVYRQDIDDIVGYIHVSELFHPDTDWRTRIKPVLFAPESMLANTIMQRMLAQKKSMTIIVDEFGGTAGLVTLEDLVEEIFGEIEDEHDRKRLDYRRLPDGDYEISGRAEIERLNEELDLDIPEDDQYHTLAGYLLHTLEAFPRKGIPVDIGPLRFTVLNATETRIQLVLVQKTDQPEN
ncbi:MAG: hemolysin family protein [Lepagella sp.]|jgi:CBS domain containing-hemolysin-like protein